MHWVRFTSEVQLRYWNSLASWIGCTTFWFHDLISRFVFGFLFQNLSSLAYLWPDQCCQLCVVNQLLVGKAIVGDCQLIDLVSKCFWVKYDSSKITNCTLPYLLHTPIGRKILDHIELCYTMLYCYRNFLDSCPQQCRGISLLRRCRSVYGDLIRLWAWVMITTVFPLKIIEDCSLFKILHVSKSWMPIKEIILSALEMCK